jgi:hypothetical protein
MMHTNRDEKKDENAAQGRKVKLQKRRREGNGIERTGWRKEIENRRAGDEIAKRNEQGNVASSWLPPFRNGGSDDCRQSELRSETPGLAMTHVSGQQKNGTGRFVHGMDCGWG